ncbi:hypothetical protein NQ318_008964 [Aromia moschata]|uniref:Protein hunchback n=1 Tax=Aromia moschata TaxID=1265417 RepID=A0AAV8ZCD4_9CUCU|nr:hypothetical protein NQ318_008964 [Aromia moschata]
MFISTMMKRKREDEESETYDDELKEILACKYCSYETVNIDELDKHIVCHELEEECEEQNVLVSGTSRKKKTTKECPADVYVCSLCDYFTKRKHDLPKHLLTHSAPGTTTIYKCSQCPYETKRKNDMPKHMLAHCTDVQMFKCPDCPYQTKRKSDLPKHLLCHKPPGEVPLYKCDFCPYVTKRKGDLPKHVLNHKDFPNLKLFNCSECEYKTKRKNDLHKHMLIHCDRHVAGVFKCLKCTYATDKVNKFSKHALSDCRICEDVINLEHLIGVEGDEIQFIGESDEEEVEYGEVYSEENDDEVNIKDEPGEYLGEQYQCCETPDPTLENYRDEIRRKHGVFNINLGEFSVDSESNCQSQMVDTEEQDYLEPENNNQEEYSNVSKNKC